MSYARNNHVEIPVLDRLAKSGTRLEKAYCSIPLCTPSRSCMFTGVMGEQTRRNLIESDCHGRPLKNAKMLFDMEKDPGKMTNPAPNPESEQILVHHQNLLKKWLKLNDDTIFVPPFE